MNILWTPGIDHTCLRTINAKYSKPRANIKLNGDKLGVFPLQSVTRERGPFYPLLFNRVAKALDGAIGPVGVIKEKKLGKETVK